MNTAHNVNPEEIEQFSKLAGEWWDTKGPMSALHELNPLRLSYIERFTTLAGKTVLDVGCGGGILSEAMGHRGAHVTGIDLSVEALDAARAHDADHRVQYQAIAVETLAEEKPKHFDIITCMEMLEHVPDPASVIRACATLLKKDGLVFFSTLNRTPQSYAVAILGAEYVLKKLPKGTHHYDQFIRPAELAAWAREANLTLKDLQGLEYQLLRKKFDFAKNVDVNYLMCFSF